MKVEVLSGLDALEPSAWNALVAASRTGSVFLTWPWQTAWVRAFARSRPLLILAVRDDDAGGALAGLLPLYEETPGDWRLVGGEDVSDYLDVAILPGREAEVWQALLAHREGQGSRWTLRGLRDGSPTLALLPGLASAHGLGTAAAVEERCPVLPLPGTWDEYLGRLPGKDRHELRRKMRRVEGELPGARVRCEADADGFGAAMDDFLRLHRASRAGKAKFMDDRMETFFRDGLRALVAAGWGRLWFLEGAAGPVASFICLEWDGTVGLYNSGFDPAASRLAPGIVLLGHVIRDAIERGAACFDFLRGEEPYKYAFGPTPSDLFRLTLAPAETAR